VIEVETARQRWTKERPHYEAFGELVAQRLRDSLKPVGVWFQVDARAKTIDSLVKKLLTKHQHTFETLPDKVGARVTIRYRADTVYKNEEMITQLDPDIKRRVSLMAGQVEVADREFDRLNMDLAATSTARLLQVLERHYYTLASQLPNRELSVEVLDSLMPVVPKGDIGAFTSSLNDFLAAKHGVLEKVYEKARELGENDTPAFLFQPEVLLIYNLLDSARDKMRKVWNENYPDRELERIANVFGVSFD